MKKIRKFKGKEEEQVNPPNPKSLSKKVKKQKLTEQYKFEKYRNLKHYLTEEE